MLDNLVEYVHRRLKNIENLFVINPLETPEEAIRRVITNTLLHDLNLVSGVTMEVAVEQSWIVSKSENEIILEIPESARDNGIITHAAWVYMNYNNGGGGIINRAQATMLPENQNNLFAMMNAHTNLAINTNVRAFGNRFISVKYPLISPAMLLHNTIKFEIGHYEDLGRNYTMELGKLALLACKMHIYIEYALDLDDLMANNPLFKDNIKTLIESFKEAEAEYDESMDLLGKIGFLNNSMDMEDLIRLSI